MYICMYFQETWTWRSCTSTGSPASATPMPSLCPTKTTHTRPVARCSASATARGRWWRVMRPSSCAALICCAPVLPINHHHHHHPHTATVVLLSRSHGDHLELRVGVVVVNQAPRAAATVRAHCAAVITPHDPDDGSVPRAARGVVVAADVPILVIELPTIGMAVMGHEKVWPGIEPASVTTKNKAIE